MNNWNQNFNPDQRNDGTSYATSQTMSQEGVRVFMRNVFGWMAAALALSAFAAYAFSHITALMDMMYTIDPQTGRVHRTVINWIVTLAPIGLVLLLGMGMNRLSLPAMIGVFLLYAAMTGASLSVIFLAYTSGVISSAFLIAAGMFAAMAILGFVTKADLTGFGGIMRMGLIGIVIAMVVNFFLHSSMLDYLISMVGVAVFTGLTAYDVQKLKNVAAESGGQGEMAAKVSIFGALTLYLDFINLFLMLLRLLGNRR